VAQNALDIDEARRTVHKVEPVLAACGLATAATEDYQRWVEERRRRTRES
jgi:hypothetical protein